MLMSDNKEVWFVRQRRVRKVSVADVEKLQRHFNQKLTVTHTSSGSLAIHADDPITAAELHEFIKQNYCPDLHNDLQLRSIPLCLL